MSLTLIESDGNLQHAQEFYDEEGENVIDTITILDEDGEMAPASICLCQAYEPSECCRQSKHGMLLRDLQTLLQHTLDCTETPLESIVIVFTTRCSLER